LAASEIRRVWGRPGRPSSPIKVLRATARGCGRLLFLRALRRLSRRRSIARLVPAVVVVARHELLFGDVAHLLVHVLIAREVLTSPAAIHSCMCSLQSGPWDASFCGCSNQGVVLYQLPRLPLHA